MALNSPVGYQEFGPPWVSVGELREAVESGFLTKEEARAVVWSQLPVLQRQAVTTPPKIEAV